ncbi:MAG: hypothetical protein LUG99_18025 [Lachnospiraceae bacterium]|nr:hypothetical protein [Lachnospiraceae bacterium]
MSKTQQRKGRAGELELARILREHGYPVRTGDALNFGGEPDLVGLDGVHCEVKRHEGEALTQWLKQAREDSEKFGDGLPAVFWRRNRGKWVVCMELADWLELYAGQKVL